MVVTGATGSGKTEWLRRFLAHRRALVTPPPEHVLYCYGELNAAVMALEREPHVEVFYGVPEEADIKRMRKEHGRLLVVLDDLMVNLRAEYLDTVFTRGSHNWDVSVVLVTQHTFSRKIRTARNNARYVVLMRNPSGALQVRTLASQLFPGARGKYFMEAYRDATHQAFSYLLVDMHPQTSDDQRLKTHIYPGETCIVYVPKNG
ncbi:Protein Y57G11C.18 [Aphelenchoides avenae]|nr:Protein Y57G11C.18 [Aphelenchus avenae]